MPRRHTAVTPAIFRRIALSLPGASEGSHQDHPDFRAHGRIFATLHRDGEWGMVKLPVSEQQRLLREHAGVFVPANGAWGRQGCTNVRLAAVDAEVVRAALTLAWQQTAGLPPVKARATPVKPKRSR